MIATPGISAPDGDSRTEDLSGFPEKFLVESIQQSSESIQHAKDKTYVGGHFLINKPIEDMLRAGLVIAGKKKEGKQ